MAVPCSQSVSRRRGKVFDPGPVQVRFVVGKAAMGQGFSSTTSRPLSFRQWFSPAKRGKTENLDVKDFPTGNREHRRKKYVLFAVKTVDMIVCLCDCGCVAHSHTQTYISKSFDDKLKTVVSSSRPRE